MSPKKRVQQNTEDADMKVHTTLSISLNLLTDLKAYSKSVEIPFSNIASEAIREYLDKKRGKPK